MSWIRADELSSKTRTHNKKKPTKGEQTSGEKNIEERSLADSRENAFSQRECLTLCSLSPLQDTHLFFSVLSLAALLYFRLMIPSKKNKNQKKRHIQKGFLSFLFPYFIFSAFFRCSLLPPFYFSRGVLSSLPLMLFQPYKKKRLLNYFFITKFFLLLFFFFQQNLLLWPCGQPKKKRIPKRKRKKRLTSRVFRHSRCV